MQQIPANLHLWNRCHECGSQPIVGQRFECQTCPAGPDRDLCSGCYARFLGGLVKHPKLRRGSTLFDNGKHHFREWQGVADPEQLASWLSVPETTAREPQVPNAFLLRPELQSGDDSFLGTYAFAIAHERAPHGFLCTALHVLDELARNSGVDCSVDNPNYTGRELPAIVSKVVVYDAFAPDWILAEAGSARRMIVVPNARTGDPEPFCQRDTALFALAPGGKLQLGKLTAGVPSLGQPLWLVASPGPKGHERRTIPAVVVASAPEVLVFRFTAREAPPRNTSGAPLIDSSGQVVGINVGCGGFSDYYFGHAVHAASIHRLIASSVISAGDQN